MRVRVDSERCQGHGRCVLASPDLFEFDDDGYALVLGDGEVPPDQEGFARQAVLNCPEQAVGAA